MKIEITNIFTNNSLENTELLERHGFKYHGDLDTGSFYLVLNPDNKTFYCTNFVGEDRCFYIQNKETFAAFVKENFKPVFKMELGKKYSNKLTFVVPMKTYNGKIVFGGLDDCVFKLYNDNPRSFKEASRYVEANFPFTLAD